jgi:hypothetical protein
VPRYDKYEPYGGGFRAALAAGVIDANKMIAYGVGLDTSGRVVLGVGNTGIIGVMIAHNVKAIGDIVDVMTQGEIVDATGLTAGTKLTANTTTGAISNAATSTTQVPIGWTVAATRIVVRTAVSATPAA